MKLAALFESSEYDTYLRSFLLDLAKIAPGKLIKHTYDKNIRYLSSAKGVYLDDSLIVYTDPWGVTVAMYGDKAQEWIDYVLEVAKHRGFETRLDDSTVQLIWPGARVTYSHKNDPKVKFSHDRSVSKIPDWAIDVREE